MIRYKINGVEKLSERGFTPTRLRTEKLIVGQTLTNLTNGKMVNMETLGKICVMLRCQPGDVIESVITDEEKIKFF